MADLSITLTTVLMHSKRGVVAIGIIVAGCGSQILAEDATPAARHGNAEFSTTDSSLDQTRLRNEPVAQLAVAATERMPALPSPLAIRPWAALAREYYTAVFDPLRQGEGFPAIVLDANDRFRMKSYLESKPDTEAFTCLAAVAGAKLCGLDPQHLHGIDFLARTKAWFDPETGLYRHRAGERGPVVHADIYGYWPAILGLILTDLYPRDPALKAAALPTFRAFHQIARGMGAPDHPSFGDLGWNFTTKTTGGRNEPMNRLGHAPALAWVLMVGGTSTGAIDMLECSRAAMQWHIDHPGRYEISHVMGPLTAARLNSMAGNNLDLGKVLNAWFGDGPRNQCPWQVTRGTRLEGLTCDGLDGARVGEDFYAFTMGSLQNPAWLIPVARYDPRYARAIGRFALHAANSCRLLQGEGLPADHQDHAAWKAKCDPENLFFYEGLRTWDPSPQRSLRPYATGDPVLNGWAGKPKVPPAEYHAQKKQWFGEKPYNISLYMGNHIGFLGGIMTPTDVPGILSWDCVKTDWFHPPAFPTRLVFNPYPDAKSVRLDLGQVRVHVYDLVSRSYLVKAASGLTSIKLAADTPAVLVLIPVSAPAPTNQANRFVSGTTVIDWNHPGPESVRRP
ncbi:MAG: hypothetical protein WCO57_14950 [Verrucomicrobiota bacterium]